VKLDCENIISCHCTGKAYSVFRISGNDFFCRKARKIAMHKVKTGVIVNATPQGVIGPLTDAIPAHVGHLQATLRAVTVTES